MRTEGAALLLVVGVAMVSLSCLPRTGPTAEQPLNAVVQAGVRSITANRLRAHMAVLAGDAMEGRETGTRGFDLAAAYVVDQFRALGLSSFSGGYLQPMTIRRGRPDEDETTLDVTVHGTRATLVYGRDFVTYGVRGSSNAATSGPLVFVGDGVTVHSAGIDAYRGLNVTGGIGVAFPGTPESLTPSERSYYGDARAKAENAAAQGFGALLVVDDPRIPWDLRVRAARQLGVSESLSADRPPTVPVVYLSPPAAEKILGELDGSIVPVGARLGSATLHVRQTIRQVRSANVVAIWPGTNPGGASEHVVVMAHLDHVGIGTPVNDDAIYNGAVDNASGVAAMITIADAFASFPTRPTRSIVFLATTGEEQGLVGSDYFVRHPPIPLHRVVAALNVDGTSISPFEQLDIRGGTTHR